MTNEKTPEEPKPVQIFPPIDEGVNGNKLVIMADHPEGRRRVAVYRRRNGELFARYERLGAQLIGRPGEDQSQRIAWRPELIPGEHFKWMAKAMVLVIAELEPPEDKEATAKS